MKLLIATSNPGKVREYEILLAKHAVTLCSLTDVGLDSMHVDEDATTLVENASIKARAYADASGLIALADDTGLFVDALAGAPGVYPARYGGLDLTMQQRRQKLLNELGDTPVEQRTARFKCVIALARPQAEHIATVSGTCEGRIAFSEDEGGSGFGYDSIFIPEGHKQSWSRVSLDEKNRISHRGQAVQKIIPIIQQL